MPLPLLASALAFIGPTLAQRGLDLLSGVFQGTVDKTTEAVAQLIKDKTGIDVNDVAEGKLTDEQWARLKEFEFEHQGKLLEYLQTTQAGEIELERIHQKDRASARDMQISALASGDPVAGRFIYWYAYLITGLTFLFFFIAAFGPELSPGNAKVVDTILGFLLGTMVSAIVQYFYGSSIGSRNKEHQIAQHLVGFPAEGAASERRQS